jgi:predicted Fe-S protein YdhL (DUF1289 family)
MFGRSKIRAVRGLRANLAEIERWAKFSDAERAQVMAELPARLEQMHARKTPPGLS